MKYQAFFTKSKKEMTQNFLSAAAIIGPFLSSADILCKQFGTRSGLTKCRAWSGSKLFDILKVILKEFFEKDDFEKNQQMTKNMKNYPSCKELTHL